jgi:hypothetical protein
MNKYTSFLFIILISFVPYCRNKKESNEINEMIKILHKTELIIPSLDSINCNYSKHITNKILLIRLIVCIDTRCKQCFDELNQWIKIIPEIKGVHNISVLFIFNSSDMEQLQNHLQKINFKYQYLIDRNDEFLLKNKLPMGRFYNTFLLDTNRRVILLGNPILTPSLINEYKSEIDKKSTLLHIH